MYILRADSVEIFFIVNNIQRYVKLNTKYNKQLKCNTYLSEF